MGCCLHLYGLELQPSGPEQFHHQSQSCQRKMVDCKVGLEHALEDMEKVTLKGAVTEMKPQMEGWTGVNGRQMYKMGTETQMQMSPRRW